MDNIIVITQNLKLHSLSAIKGEIVPGSILIVSTQYVFENERDVINERLGVDCKYLDFADLLNDKGRQKCDEDAYNSSLSSVADYYNEIKRLKNENIVNSLMKEYPCNNCILLCDDLGIDKNVWTSNGYREIQGEYYHVKEASETESIFKRGINVVISAFHRIKHYLHDPIWQAEFNGTKYLFFGSTNRIGYRINMEFQKASKIENIKFFLQFISCRLFGVMPANKTVRMTTFHEDGKWSLPDHPNMNVKKIQDGYLPPNYTSKYLCFFGKNTEFYSWDEIGRHTFEYHQLKNRIMPFRKKLYLPEPRFPERIKKVLCVASGAGDWTAIKNRSDEDMMMLAFGRVAALFPDIEFIYRCHPVWIHPEHQGVNSIHRAAEFFDYLNLPNLKLSGNIPDANKGDQFVLSYKRSSFEDDLKDVDLVFGEHSISMIDAGFKNILFASCNVTGHRDFFEDITKLGFPHCENIEEIVNLINNIASLEFKDAYLKAVSNYNIMTDKEF